MFRLLGYVLFAFLLLFFSCQSASAVEREVPVRFVQFVSDCTKAVTDTQIQNVINTANGVYSAAGLSFKARAVTNPKCASGVPVTLSHVVVSSLSDVSDKNPLSEAALSLAKDAFNPSCNMGYSDLAQLPKGEQIWWVAARCALSGEALVYVANTGGSNAANDPGDGKLIILNPSAIKDQNVTSGQFAHEMGHYLGLPHAFGFGFSELGYIDPATGQGSTMATFWDLVYAATSPPRVFKDKASASLWESLLIPIQSSGASNAYKDGWYCPSQSVSKPCPFASPPIGTIGVPLGGASPVWYTFLPNSSIWDDRLKGLAPHAADGSPGINIMGYNYQPYEPNGPKVSQRLSLSQIEVIQANLNTDVLTRYLDATGHVIFGDRPRLGTTGRPPAQLTYVPTYEFATKGPGTIAANGWHAWSVGTRPFDADGNQVLEWDARFRVWSPRPGGAKQIALLSEGTNQPWIITASGSVKRWNGSGFVVLPAGAGCARSLAVGPSYAWAVGCNPLNADGNGQIFRYNDVAGWQPTTGWAVQVAVDWQGVPWARTIQGLIYRANLDANGFPTTWEEFRLNGGTADWLTAGSPARGGSNTRLPPNILGSDGHVYIFRSAGTSVHWADAGAPPVTFGWIAGPLPYLWAVEASTGRIWYAR